MYQSCMPQWAVYRNFQNNPTCYKCISELHKTNVCTIKLGTNIPEMHTATFNIIQLITNVIKLHKSWPNWIQTYLCCIKQLSASNWLQIYIRVAWNTFHHNRNDYKDIRVAYHIFPYDRTGYKCMSCRKRQFAMEKTGHGRRHWSWSTLIL